MNQNSAAQSCAKEIAQQIDNLLADCNCAGGLKEQFYQYALMGIENALSSEVAKVHGEYKKLAQSWKSSANDLDDKWRYGVMGQGRAAAFRTAAGDVEALAPNKEG